MKDRTIKSAFFAALFLLSLTCFVFVNTAPIERASVLSVQQITQTTRSDEEKTEKNYKMPDLVLVKSVLTILQKFLHYLLLFVSVL